MRVVAPSLAVEARATRRTSAAGPSSADQSKSSALIRSICTMAGGYATTGRRRQRDLDREVEPEGASSDDFSACSSAAGSPTAGAAWSRGGSTNR